MAQVVAGGFLGILPTSSFTQTYEIDRNATTGPTHTWEFARSEDIGLVVNPLNSEWDDYAITSTTGPSMGTMTQHASGIGDLDGLQPDGAWNAGIPPGRNAYTSDAFTFTFNTSSLAWQNLAVGGSITVTYTVTGTEYNTNYVPIFNPNQTTTDNFLITMTFVKTCFAGDSMILLADGCLRRADEIRRGDLIMTLDNGPQPVRWVGHAAVMTVEMAHFANLRPVRIRAGALGPSVPTHDLIVSQQHRILVCGNIARRMFGTSEVLLAAKHLTAIDGIDILTDGDGLTYVHLMFDQHQIISANGAFSESFFIGDESRRQISADQRQELEGLFPELAAMVKSGHFEPVRQFVGGTKARKMAQRIAANAAHLQ